MRQRRLATVDVFVIAGASGGKQISADSPSSPIAPSPVPSPLSAVSLREGMGGV